MKNTRNSSIGNIVSRAMRIAGHEFDAPGDMDAAAREQEAMNAQELPQDEMSTDQDQEEESGQEPSKGSLDDMWTEFWDKKDNEPLQEERYENTPVMARKKCKDGVEVEVRVARPTNQGVKVLIAKNW